MENPEVWCLNLMSQKSEFGPKRGVKLSTNLKVGLHSLILSYLSNISDEYLSDEVRQKISELAAE